MARPDRAKKSAFESLGPWLRRLRKKKGVPLRTVAAAAQMDQAHLSKIELGRRVPTRRQADALARYFDLERRGFGARRIAAKFQTDFAGNPAAGLAIKLLNEKRL